MCLMQSTLLFFSLYDTIYLVFGKVSDIVPHPRLLLKLQAHDVDRKVLHWITTWLSDRKQRV